MSASIRVSLRTPAREIFERVGILKAGSPIPTHLELFVAQSEQVLERIRGEVDSGAMPADKAAAFQQLLVDACARVMCHPIIASNRYLKRFSQGVTQAQARHELQQFSVFALQFDVAQAKLMANAPSLEAYQERLNVLLNEKGIPYKDGFEGELTGKWNYGTVHFTWLLNMAEGLGLKFEELGKIWVGSEGTKKFVACVFDTYAGLDQNSAQGASFGIENWAANNLWTPWIAGMRKYNEAAGKAVNLGYLTYHESEERHHSQATIDELLENFMEPWFDDERFLTGAERVLDEGVQVYYESQLASLPDRDDTWPNSACAPRAFDPYTLPRLAVESVTV
jgi:pyrroloquinoline quinone (PQQ) biosynthesis protein C